MSPEDVIKCEERYSKSRAVNSIVTHVAHKLNRPVEELYEKVVWPLDRTYGHSYDAFKLSVTEAAKVFEGIDLDPIVMRELEANIARRLTPQPVKIRADVEVSCFGYEGIDAVKNALRAGEALSTENIPIKIKLVAPPLYVLVTHSTDWRYRADGAGAREDRRDNPEERGQCHGQDEAQGRVGRRR